MEKYKLLFSAILAVVSTTSPTPPLTLDTAPEIPVTLAVIKPLESIMILLPPVRADMDLVLVKYKLVPPIDSETAKKVFELIEAIEELDDVQNVYGNFDVSDEVMASLST